MLYTLDFDPGDPKYERLYAACCHLSQKNPTDRKEQKVNNSLLDKLESVGRPIPALDDKGMVRAHRRSELKFYETVAGGVLVLEQAEYDMAKEHMLSAIPMVHRQVGAEHEAAMAWLEAVKGQEPRAAEKAAPTAAEG